ncbi:hypothetical protein KCP78_21850 [Salmonella enterica subsp. enterica]|nr:hypothetical protein KCP78_21850 [Salmonella enterica subsp. enterica]
MAAIRPTAKKIARPDKGVYRHPTTCSRLPDGATLIRLSQRLRSSEAVNISHLLAFSELFAAGIKPFRTAQVSQCQRLLLILFNKARFWI